MIEIRLLVFPQLIHFHECGERVVLWHELQPISVFLGGACCHDNEVCGTDVSGGRETRVVER